MHATDIVAYTYQAETLCPECTVSALDVPQSVLSEHTVEGLLEILAVARGIDYAHEDTYDSGDFPKVVFASQIEDDEHCGMCEESLHFDRVTPLDN